jgi:hypothetical protein
MHELGSIDVMRHDQTLGPVASCCLRISSCISIRTSLEEGIKLHRFAGMFPEQFSTEAGRYREAVVAADLAFAMISPASSTMFLMYRLPNRTHRLVDAPFWRHHEGRDRQWIK